MSRLVTISPTETQLRAAWRILQGMLNHDHPVVQRAVAESLHDSRPSDAFAFAQLCGGSLLASDVPTAPLNAHVTSIDPATSR